MCIHRVNLGMIATTTKSKNVDLSANFHILCGREDVQASNREVQRGKAIQGEMIFVLCDLFWRENKVMWINDHNGGA